MLANRRHLKGLQKYGLLANEFWREERPDLHERLRRKGTLNRHLKAAERSALVALGSLFDRGYNLLAAEEILIKEYLKPPKPDQSDQDLPASRPRFRPTTPPATSGPTIG